MTYRPRLSGPPAGLVARVAPAGEPPAAGGRGKPVGPRHPAHSGPAARARRARAVALAAMLAAVSLATAPAQSAAADTAAATSGTAELQPAPAGSSPGALARLEARAASLARQYRGQLVQLTDAEKAAQAAAARVAQLRRQLGHAHADLARLAAAIYMGGWQDPMVAMVGNGNPQRILQDTATVAYLARHHAFQQQSLEQYMAAVQRAGQAARAKIGGLRRLVTELGSQRHRIAALLARFHPQSPLIGGTITPRMRQVKDTIDRRFGPFSSIGCYRAGNDGEHPLGRACDFMLSTGGAMPAAANVRRGYDIAAWAQANASRLGIMYIIYRQRAWDIRMASSGWVPMADRGSITANHFDHVHISVF